MTQLGLQLTITNLSTKDFKTKRYLIYNDIKQKKSSQKPEPENVTYLLVK